MNSIGGYNFPSFTFIAILLSFYFPFIGILSPSSPPPRIGAKNRGVYRCSLSTGTVGRWKARNRWVSEAQCSGETTEREEGEWKKEELILLVASHSALIALAITSSVSLWAARMDRFQYTRMELEDGQFVDVHCTEAHAIAWEADTPGANSGVCGCNRKTPRHSLLQISRYPLNTE